MNISYKTQTASKSQIYEHIKQCDYNFSPPLSSRVNLDEYANKISGKAVSFEAWDNDILAGMVNAYFNDPEKHESYITNVSLLVEYMGNGIASTLVKMCVDYATEHGFKKIILEVEKNNKRAINLYKKSGFQTSEFTFDYPSEMVYMVKIINQVANENEENMKPKQRDYNTEINDSATHQYMYSFDSDIMHPFMIKSFEPFFQTGNLLELGSFRGQFTKRFLPYFEDITCVEASDVAVTEAKKLLGDKVKIINSLFENASLSIKYKNIILTHVLEHIDDPIELLKKINNEWLDDNGRLFLVCPNANAASRQIAVKMNIISHNSAITEAEAEHGHRITYSFDTLERDVKMAGLKIAYRSGIFFKALANFQWDKLLKTDIISKEYLDGCYQLGQNYPDLCSSIFLLCEKNSKSGNAS